MIFSSDLAPDDFPLFPIKICHTDMDKLGQIGSPISSCFFNRKMMRKNQIDN